MIRPNLPVPLRKWYALLGLAKHPSKSWYRDRIVEEMKERRTATTTLQQLSETSDVLFSMTRALYDGQYTKRPPPVRTAMHFLNYTYMVAKYTSRWGFYQVAARLSHGAYRTSVREVVNPAKDAKLFEVASRHRVDTQSFVLVARRLRMIWPLLP